MITGEIEYEGQQPSELIKKIKENQIEITYNVCYRIIEGFYKEFDIEKDVDTELLNHEVVCLHPDLPDGFSEFVACYFYLRQTGGIYVEPVCYNYRDSGYSLGKDLLLDFYREIILHGYSKNNKEIHYLVSKCIDLFVPF